MLQGLIFRSKINKRHEGNHSKAPHVAVAGVLCGVGGSEPGDRGHCLVPLLPLLQRRSPVQAPEQRHQVQYILELSTGHREKQWPENNVFNIFLIVKVIGTFNKEKELLGAFFGFWTLLTVNLREVPLTALISIQYIK